MNKVLVTGGAGYIGSHTVVELLEAGFNPIIVDNFENSDRSVLEKLKLLTRKNITFYEGDFGDSRLLTEVIKNENVSSIIHFAAYKAVGESVKNPLKYYQNNVSGLINLLRIIGNFNVSSFVFSSSCTVYGEAKILPITENEEIKPASSPYGSTKQMDETIIKDFVLASNSLKVASLRYFNPIGAHPSSLIGELPLGIPANLVPFVTQTAAGIRKELVINGNDYPTPDGTCIRDYIHVVDLAKAHVNALRHLLNQKEGYYDTFNIGTGKGSSVLEVIKSFEKTTGKKVTYKIGPRRQGDIISAYAAVDKAKSILEWQPTLSLEDALRDAWNWQQSISRT
ncbi:UDP-glucose 4-epimerase GalE [Candidatus Saccharibacteria bacterium]|nr:UDP-glucose 4-epimerase GalE [Candidatus Saccharibacteria bacterium]